VKGWQSIGAHYERTLLAWRANCERSWGRMADCDRRFRRMWYYYLSASAAAFRAKKLDVWQVLLEPVT
ncbi:MAG TPA: class I SAM-dependent methyltransferase, partial [Steroidobacteraceae bacterium]